MAKQKPICTKCGGDDIRVDAYAAWNVHSQTWELVAAFDHTDCEKCGGECRVEWIAIEEEASK